MRSNISLPNPAPFPRLFPTTRFAYLLDRREKAQSTHAAGIEVAMSKSRLSLAILLTLGCILLPLTSCGGGGGGGGTEYDYGISLTPDKSMVDPGSTVNLNVHYDAPANNAGITWQVGCDFSNCGSVSASGIYTAPATVEEQMSVGIRATSKDRPTSSYFVQVWVRGKVVVRITPANDPVYVLTGLTMQFNATVNSPDTQVAWQVNNALGGNSTTGTISAAGIYTAPAQIPDPATVTVSAVAHVDQSTSGSVRVQIMNPAPVSVSITPRDATVNVGDFMQFTASVLNTDDKAVVWKVNGIEGGNSTVGMIAADGSFFAPDSMPSPAVETISAISHADPTKSDSTFVTIVGLKNSVLNGSYVFQMSGPDANGYMRAAIGYLNFDGNGGLTGMMDSNSLTAAAAQVMMSFSGTYGVGLDNRGTMTFNTTPALTLAFTLNESADSTKLIEWDSRGTRYAGSMQRQTPTDFALSKINGNYAVSVFGATMTNERQVAVGRFSVDGAGHVSLAEIDTKEGADIAVTLPNLTGSVTITDTTRGRGIFTLFESATSAVQFSFYLSNAGEFYILSTDPVPSDNPLVIGHVLAQIGAPFSNESLSGASVFESSGVGAINPAHSCATVGEWKATSGTHSLTGMQDSICDGNVTQGNSITASYAIDSNGRGTLTGSSLFGADVFYMISQNKVFLLQTSGLEDMIGTAEPQTTASFSNSQFNGTYRIGPITMASPGADLSQGFLVANGSGTFTGTEDVLGQDVLTLTFAGINSVDSSGRTTLTFTSPETFHYVAYPVSSTRFVGISIESGDTQAILTSLDQ